MSFSPKPCAHCGGLSFQVLPGMQSEVWLATTVLGMAASHKLTGGVRWSLTAVICTQCGLTQAFTSNAPQLAQHIPGAHVVSATPR